MLLRSSILSLLLVTTAGSPARSQKLSLESPLKVTSKELDRLNHQFKTAPSSAQKPKNLDSLAVSQDLDKSQLVEAVLSQNSVNPQSTESKQTILQSLYVKPEGIIFYSIGNDPTVLIDSNKEPGVVRITLNETLLDSRFKLSQKSEQTDSAIDSVQVNQISTQPAIVEIIIKTDHQNWQFAPRQGGFILTQIQEPSNSVVQSPITTPPSPSTSETGLVPGSTENITQSTLDNDATSPLENTDRPIPSIEETTPKSSSEIALPLTPLQLPPTQLINLETANVLPQGSILTTYGAHIFPKGQFGSGTGLQTYNISIEGGVTNNFQLGLAWVLFDDSLGQQINEGVPDLGVLSFAPKFKYQFLKETNFSLAVSGSLEIGKFTGSYGLYTPNNLQQTSTILAGTLQLPFTYNLTSNFQAHLVPGVIFFPNTINNGGEFYGTLFNIGAGFNYNLLDRLMLFADVNLAVGSGGNAINNQGQTVTKPVWAAGLTYLQSPTVGIDLYATNALGATPATQVLAFIPNGGQVAAGVNIRYTPDIGQNYPSSFRLGPSIPLSFRDKQLLFNGITLTSANTVKNGMFSLQGGVGPAVNFQLAYGMSDNAQLEFIGQQLGNSDQPVGNSFKLGVGTKLQFLDQVQGDPFSLSLRGAIEESSQSSSDGVGIFTTELAFLYQVNPQIALMFNPKGGFFGSTSIVGTGLGINYQILDGLQLIGEVTPILTGGGSTIWTGGIRYIHPEWNAGIDLYGTNAIGTHDIGGLISQSNNNVSVGFNLLWLFSR